MALSSGTRLGAYEITGPLGAGGMGEVYRARDTKLGREVALKVLPDLFARDHERLARFQQEARLLAALNHPHIAAIYGLEEATAGAAGPVRFLVLELVEGETLAERIGRGALPVDEALAVCRQIAEALEAAHERGIIHRDLKPANIKVTPEEQVKVLDFGLGKAFGPREVSPGASPGQSPADAAAAVDLSQSPTLTAAATREGIILGTAAYMSPEQARGRPVDKRTDIWAFGCVLYEALAGKQAFAGETVSDTIAKILERDPDWKALPQPTPWVVGRLLRRCFEKDLRHRPRDIGDLRLELEQSAESTAGPGAAPADRRPAWLRALPWCLVGLLATSTGFAWWRLMSTPAGDVLPVTRLSVHLPASQHLAGGQPLPFAISDDGRQLAYVAQEGARTQIHVRKLDSYESRPIPGTDRATFPFFSPDGQWLGFFADRKLKKVLVAGGTPSTIADAPLGMGGTWSRGGMLVFASSVSAGLVIVPSTGGEARSLTRPDFKESGYAHVYPQFLPDGSSVLFTIWGGKADSRTKDASRPIFIDTLVRAAVLSLGSGTWRTVALDATGSVWADSGHLVFGNAEDMSQLMTIAFDPARHMTFGAPTPVLQSVSIVPYSARPSLRVSRTGTLAYMPGSAKERMLTWVTPGGPPRSFWSEPGDYLGPRLSPTGDRVAVSTGGVLWVVDIRRGSKVSATRWGIGPVWSPDGKEIAFSSNRGGNWNLYAVNADGSGHERPLLVQEFNQWATSWSPDGGRLLFTQIHPDGGADIWHLLHDGKASPLLATPFNEYGARFSPDGRWIAFASDESGKDEVYVQESSGRGVKWAISVDGGTMPIWSRDGRSIFYHNGDDLLVVSIEARPALKASAPRRFLSGPYEWDDFQKYYSASSYDVAPDGSTFLMIQRQGESAGTELRVVLNWTEELKRLVPVGKD